MLVTDEVTGGRWQVGERWQVGREVAMARCSCHYCQDEQILLTGRLMLEQGDRRRRRCRYRMSH